MESDNRLILLSLKDRFSNRRLEDIYRSFHNCSRDGNAERYLVSSEIKAINFDKLTEWLYEGSWPKSADSLTFSKDWIYLIEFKTGDYSKEWTCQKMLNSARNKIIDSEKTIIEKIVEPIKYIDKKNIRLKFFLVVSLLDVGPSAEVSILAKLSDGAINLNDNQKRLLSGIVHIDNEITNPDSHYDVIDVWYGELFDQYLKKEGIIDISKIAI